MVRVLRMFRTSLVAVPALSRVDPVSTSGPTSMARTTSGRRLRVNFRFGLKQSNAVRAPASRAAANPPQT